MQKGDEVDEGAAIGPLLYVPTSVDPPNAFEDRGENRFTAYDPADGRVRWRQAGVLDQVDPVTSTVYFSDVGGNVLAAIDAETGRSRWLHNADTTKRYSFLPGGMRAAVGRSVVLAYRRWEAPGYIAAVDGKGAPLWRVSRPPDSIADILLRGDTVYAASSEPDPEEPDSNFHLSAREAGTGQLRWQRELAIVSPRLLGIREHEGRLAAIVSSQWHQEPPNPATLVVVDGRTGKTHWSHDLGGTIYPYRETYAEFIAEGFLHSHAGRLTMYDASTGKVLWSVDTEPQPDNRERNDSHAPGLIRTAPNGILISGDKYVSCVDPATGTERWRAPTDVAFISNIAVAGDVAYAMGLREQPGDYSPVSYIVSLDLRTGTPQWRYQHANAAMTYLASTPDAVFVATKDAVQRIGPP